MLSISHTDKSLAAAVRPRCACHSAVWYHVVSGRKVFLAAPTTPGNLRAFEEWSSSGKQASGTGGCYACPPACPHVWLPLFPAHSAACLPPHPSCGTLVSSALYPLCLCHQPPVWRQRPAAAKHPAVPSCQPTCVQASSWLGDKLSGLVRLSVGAGDTLLLPSAWPHAVSTPEPSFAVGARPVSRSVPILPALGPSLDKADERRPCLCCRVSSAPGSACWSQVVACLWAEVWAARQAHFAETLWARPGCPAGPPHQGTHPLHLGCPSDLPCRRQFPARPGLWRHCRVLPTRAAAGGHAQVPGAVSG